MAGRWAALSGAAPRTADTATFLSLTSILIIHGLVEDYSLSTFETEDRHGG
jgi:hypothetical protein